MLDVYILFFIRYIDSFVADNFRIKASKYAKNLDAVILDLETRNSKMIFFLDFNIISANILIAWIFFGDDILKRTIIFINVW